jgi:hypothetical protein
VLVPYGTLRRALAALLFHDSAPLMPDTQSLK